MTGQIALTAIMTGLVSLGTGVRWTPPRSVLWWSGRTHLAARPPRPGPWTGLRPRGPLVDGLVTGRIALTVIMTGLRALRVEGLAHRLVAGWLCVNRWSSRTPLAARPPRPGPWTGLRPRGTLADGLVTGRIAPTVIVTGLRVLWVEGLVHRLVLGWLGGNRTPLISRPGRRETFLGRRRASSPLWLPGALSLADHLPSGFPLLRWS